MEKILKCKNVVLKYGTKEALHGINMEIEQDKRLVRLAVASRHC